MAKKKTPTTKAVETVKTEKATKKNELEFKVVEATPERVEHLHIIGEEVDVVIEKNYINIVKYKGILNNLREINEAFAERTNNRIQISRKLTFIVDGVDQETFKWSLIW